MTLEWGSKEGEAKEKQKLAERKLRIAKKRLETAQSEELGEKVDRDRWIDAFVKEVRSQRARVDKLQRLADEAQRDLKPYNQWLLGRHTEWAKWEETSEEEGYRLAELETSSVEYRTKFDKMQELQKRASEASSAHFWAGEEHKFAEELLEAARTEDLAPTVERAALIRQIQKEVRFAEFHLEEEKESTKVLDLKTDVISTLYSITSLKGKIKRHKVLLDWIERQRRELIGDSASTGQKISPRRSMRVGSRNLPSSPGTEASSVDHAAKKRARPQKPSTAKSIFDPVHSAKVTKTPKQKREGRRRRSVPRDTSRAAEKTNADFNTAKLKSDAAVSVKDRMHVRLRPGHSSRVSKSASKRPIGRQKDTTRGRHRRTGEELLRMSTSSKEVIDQSMNTSM